MAQWSVTLDLLGNLPRPPLALTRASAAEQKSEETAHLVDMHYVQEVMRRFRQLSPDATECSCLKAIVLFRPGMFTFENVLMISYQTTRKHYLVKRTKFLIDPSNFLNPIWLITNRYSRPNNLVELTKC